MFEFDPTTDRRSTAAALERLDGEIGEYFESLSTKELLAPWGEFWSPCGHLRRLFESVVPVAGAMRWPRPLLRLLFGRSRGGSMDFAAIRERYHEALSGGLRAGRCGPPRRPDELPPEAGRGRAPGNWRRPGGELQSALAAAR